MSNAEKNLSLKIPKFLGRNLLRVRVLLMNLKFRILEFGENKKIISELGL